MPVYEYECESCGERFETLVRSIHQEPPEVPCPACQGTEVRRLIACNSHDSSSINAGPTHLWKISPHPIKPHFNVCMLFHLL